MWPSDILFVASKNVLCLNLTTEFDSEAPARFTTVEQLDDCFPWHIGMQNNINDNVLHEHHMESMADMDAPDYFDDEIFIPDDESDIELA